MSLATADLAALDDAISAAFASADASRLDVLGYGEITTVVAWVSGGVRYACKRLPPFPSAADADGYAALFAEYLDTLAACGVRVVPSWLQRLPAGDGAAVLYCVQPVMPPERLAVRVLERSDDAAAARLFATVLDRIMGSVSARVGLDGQLSNWMVDGDDVLFLDVTTPMLKDEAGQDRLDKELFLAAVPFPVRPLFRNFLMRGVIDKYHQPRTVVLDLVANLIKEGLAQHIEPFLAIANRRLSPPIESAEVHRYYDEDARLWAIWQAMRRCDRFVRLRLLRQSYPFLLPGRIERRRASADAAPQR